MPENNQQEKEASVQLIAILEILKSGYWYDKKVREVLKPFDISHEQFNVLRILEHNQLRKFSLKEIQSRLMNKTDNTTRLVEKLRQKGFVASAYSEANRRMLQIGITPDGMNLLKEISLPLLQLGEKVNSVLPDEDALEVTRILRNFRSMK